MRPELKRVLPVLGVVSWRGGAIPLGPSDPHLLGGPFESAYGDHVLNLSEVPFLHTQISRDVEHDLAVVAVAAEEPLQAVQSFVAVCEADGTVIAWDQIEAPSQITYLGDLPWGPSRGASGLNFDANATWLAAGLGRFLLPSWSLPLRAASLVDSWGHAIDDGAVENLRRGRLNAYLPLVDRDAFATELERLRAKQ